MTITSPKCAIFDLDGTLFRTDSFYPEAFRRAIDDNDLEQKTEREIIALFAFTTPEICRRLFPAISPSEISVLSDRVRYYERMLISSHGRLYEGMETLLRRLINEGWKCALCTNGSPEYVNNVIDGLNLRHLFDTIRLREGTTTKTENLRNLRRMYGDFCIMIGDKAGDIEAATANGIPSIGVTWGYGSRNELINASYIVTSVRELTSLFFSDRIPPLPGGTPLQES